MYNLADGGFLLLVVECTDNCSNLNRTTLHRVTSFDSAGIRNGVFSYEPAKFFGDEYKLSFVRLFENESTKEYCMLAMCNGACYNVREEEILNRKVICISDDLSY